jgi:hypothetical protein
VFTETASRARSDRPPSCSSWTSSAPATSSCLEDGPPGRSLRHLVDTVTGLADRGVGFRRPAGGDRHHHHHHLGGKLVFHVFIALAEVERDPAARARQPGWPRPRDRGRRGGRPSVMTVGLPAPYCVGSCCSREQSHSNCLMSWIQQETRRHNAQHEPQRFKPSQQPSNRLARLGRALSQPSFPVPPN